MRDIQLERELAVENDPMLAEGVEEEEESVEEEARRAQESGEVFEGGRRGDGL